MAHCLNCNKVGDCWTLVDHCDKMGHYWDDCIPNRAQCNHKKQNDEEVKQ